MFVLKVTENTNNIRNFLHFHQTLTVCLTSHYGNKCTQSQIHVYVPAIGLFTFYFLNKFLPHLKVWV